MACDCLAFLVKMLLMLVQSCRLSAKINSFAGYTSSTSWNPGHKFLHTLVDLFPALKLLCGLSAVSPRKIFRHHLGWLLGTGLVVIQESSWTSISLFTVPSVQRMVPMSNIFLTFICSSSLPFSTFLAVQIPYQKPP